MIHISHDLQIGLKLVFSQPGPQAERIGCRLTTQHTCFIAPRNHIVELSYLAIYCTTNIQFPGAVNIMSSIAKLEGTWQDTNKMSVSKQTAHQIIMRLHNQQTRKPLAPNVKVIAGESI